MSHAERLAEIIAVMSLQEVEEVAKRIMPRLQNNEPEFPLHLHEHMAVMLIYDIRDAYRPDTQ